MVTSCHISGNVLLAAAFKVEIPNLASLAGKRLVVLAYLLSSLRKRIFTSDTRIDPVDFGYPARQIDELKLQLPEGHSMEESPTRRKSQLPWADYEFSAAVEGNQLLINRTLRLDKSLFAAQDDAQLQTLSAVVQAGDASQAILQLKQAACLGIREGPKDPGGQPSAIFFSSISKTGKHHIVPSSKRAAILPPGGSAEFSVAYSL